MIKYMKQHERYIEEMCARNLSEEAWKELIKYHDKQIQWMQQERLAHLITMLFVCLFTLLSWGLTFATPTSASFILLALLMILSIGYIVHYYRLENGIQKWYQLSNQIRGNYQLYSSADIPD